ncbi:MAG: diacylglycerol kinase [Fulvimarina manganoxydans]|uniref:diacylglycerol/lipid kinase family protein n=1 Tax=Fulvimarina manganoxydans TaxID=937218 RepID=UPI002354F77A|nr:diacylglycerol kinase family protein [Fulvimarina manganoxydans]MCK5934144.1 diacylglycerol kinase [Fulvimarina manganoxydans]
MKVLALLNRDGGTLKTTDLDWLRALIEDEFKMHGHEIEVSVCSGDAIVESIRKGVDRPDLDILLVGGGDGTVSAAAAACAGTQTALGILPAGTMNLFARTLQIPLGLEQAVAALAAGSVTAVDVGKVNGRVFVHQFAVGLHARMVRMRKKISYGSRFGKVLATWRAGWMAVRSLPSIKLEIDVDGERREEIRSPAVAFSNNFYGDGHLPFADDPKGGSLGVYVCRAKKFGPMSKLILDIMRGTWRQNADLESFRAKRVRLIYEGRHHKNRAVQDGELVTLERDTVIEVVAKGLQILAPAEATYLTESNSTRSEPITVSIG